MPIDSWMTPEEAPALAASATAMIDAALVGSGLTREGYWAAVRKGYNTPYNDPQPKSVAVACPVPIDLETAPLSVAAMAAHVATAEVHAG